MVFKDVFLNFRCSLFSSIDKYTWILGTSNLIIFYFPFIAPSSACINTPFYDLHPRNLRILNFSLHIKSLTGPIIPIWNIFFSLFSLPEDWLRVGLCFFWTESESVIFSPGTTLKSPWEFLKGKAEGIKASIEILIQLVWCGARLFHLKNASPVIIMQQGLRTGLRAWRGSNKTLKNYI